MRKILSIFGTRPEAIKMAPVVKELERRPDDFTSIVCVTAQHREMLDQVLADFKIRPDFDLDVMKAGQDLFQITSAVLTGLRDVIAQSRPDLILVHGDTTTTMAAALAAFYRRTKIGHVEAGLRTRDKFAPYPEEMNRRVTGAIADLHFAPTPGARQNLIEEAVDPKAIYVTGNTAVDALFAALALIEKDPGLRERFAAQFSFLDPEKRLILVTGHRRENFGEGFQNICRALAEVASNQPGVQILYPVHLNPNVCGPVRKVLGNMEGANIFLIDPVEYLAFVYLMNRSYMIVTDSGGIQEEAPSLRKPVLIMREVTERPEGVKAGAIKIIGTKAARICSSIERLLSDTIEYQEMTSAGNPYGDGKAAERIVGIIHDHFSGSQF
ncbi:MAG: UDP-N-acetylglucosamine 2-epimerase (non-hydrolyzing) [Syntrophobacteraceae bacterium]|jgi:UDP-N-acetylglucosamine 2-epimerase (non-hydrolysing)